MSKPFSFPPPPPPPPKPANSGHPSGYPSRGQYQNHNHNPRGQSTYGASRGRGRGRGSFRGGSVNHRGHHQSGSLRDGQLASQGFGVPGDDSGRPGSSCGSSNHGPPHIRKPFQHTPGGGKSRREEIPKVPAAPAIPAFGQFIPAVGLGSTPVTNTRPEQSSEPVRKKRKANQLGLTPIGEDVSDEEVDEEAKYASVGQKLVFEYNGSVSTLNSTEDVQAWIEERKRKWPTKARIEAKQKEAEIAAKAFRERRVAEMSELVENSKTNRAHEKSRESRKSTKRQHGQQDDARRDKRIAKLEKELEKLKAETAKADKLSLEKAARLPTPDEDTNTAMKEEKCSEPRKNTIGGLETYEETSSAASSVLSESESTEVSTDDDSPSAEEASSIGSAPPEEESSRKQETLQRVPPPPRPQNPKANARDMVKVPRGVCPYFYRRGHCNRGRNCRLKHFKPEEPRKSLYQRLVEQEKEAENLKVVQAVKMLGQQGFFDDPKPSTSTS